MTQTLTYRGTLHQPDTPTLNIQDVSLAYTTTNLAAAYGGHFPPHSNGTVQLMAAGECKTDGLVTGSPAV